MKYFNKNIWICFLQMSQGYIVCVYVWEEGKGGGERRGGERRRGKEEGRGGWSCNQVSVISKAPHSTAYVRASRGRGVSRLIGVDVL